MRSTLAGALVVIALSSPAVARAQSRDDLARADSLFNAAKALLDGGQYKDACAKFAESKQLAPGLGVTLYLADCYERIGRFASAWTEFRSAEGLAQQRSDKRAAVARARADALEPKLDRLTVTVAPTVPQAGLQILLDGTAISSEELGLPAPVDPGDHVIVVSSQGKVRRTIHTHLGPEAPNASVQIDTLDESAQPPQAAPVQAVPTETAAPSESAATSLATPEPSPDQGTGSDPGKTRRWIGIGTGAVGVVALGVGAGFGLSAMSKLSDSNAGLPQNCNQASDVCGPQGRDLRSSAGSAATVSTVFFAVGAVAVATGVVLYVTAPHASVSIAPAATAGGGGALLSGRF